MTARVGARRGVPGLEGMPWLSTLALVTRRRRVGVLGLLARMGGNFGEVAVWDCAKCSMELRSYHRAGNCFPQMCLKLSFRQLSFLGGNGLGGWEWHG